MCRQARDGVKLAAAWKLAPQRSILEVWNARFDISFAMYTALLYFYKVARFNHDSNTEEHSRCFEIFQDIVVSDDSVHTAPNTEEYYIECVSAFI